MIHPAKDKQEHPDSGSDKKEKPAAPPPVNTRDQHLGSSNAFEETENPASGDPDGITDEKLDEWLDE